jgi:tetratricopeptide (TPR) repeat protein
MVWEDALGRFADDPPGENPFIAPKLSYNKGYALYQLGRLDEAVAVCDGLIAAHSRESALQARLLAAEAMGLKRSALGRAHRDEDVLVAIDELLARFGDATEPELREKVARALAKKTTCLLEAGRADEAIAVTDELILRLDTETDPAAVAQLAEILLKARAQLFAAKRLDLQRLLPERMRQKRFGQALKISASLVTRLRNAADPTLTTLMVHAQISTASSLSRLGHLKQAMAAYDEIFDLGEPAITALEEIANRAEQTDAPYMREQLAWALLARASIIGRLNRREEAVDAFNQVINRLQADKDPIARLILRLARKGREEALAH